jgi:hypothetical protein
VGLSGDRRERAYYPRTKPSRWPVTWSDRSVARNSTTLAQSSTVPSRRNASQLGPITTALNTARNDHRHDPPARDHARGYTLGGDPEWPKILSPIPTARHLASPARLVRLSPWSTLQRSVGSMPRPMSSSQRHRADLLVTSVVLFGSFQTSSFFSLAQLYTVLGVNKAPAFGRTLKSRLRKSAIAVAPIRLSAPPPRIGGGVAIVTARAASSALLAMPRILI